MKKKLIYLDFAAAMPVAPEVINAMKSYWRDCFGNPSSLHNCGTEAREAVKMSRKKISRCISCLPEEIIFTSGGTESINLALKGYITAQKKPRQHIISTTIEHPATAETLNHLKKLGHRVTLIPCETNGIVDAQKVITAITDNTTLISVIYVQNEIGTIQPIAEIGKLLININRQRIRKNLTPVIFHTDTCQAPAFLNIHLPKLHVDMLTLDASKIYGPKGVGLLFIKRGLTLTPQLHGGGQEHELRSGTENVPGIVGLAAALEYCVQRQQKQSQRISKLRDYIIERLEKEIPNLRLTGDKKMRIANNIHVTIKGVEGESLLFYLDKAGICVSTGSACSTAQQTESSVLKTLHIPKLFRKGSLRITLCYQTTKRDVDTTLTALKKIVQKLRKKF